MKTVLLVEIDHRKPLPERQDITDIAAQRLYGWLYSQGCEAGVTAKRLTLDAVDHGQMQEVADGD